MKTFFWRVIQLRRAFSCQTLHVSPAGLGGPGEAKAPAGAEFCVLSSGAYLAAFNSWITDEEGAATGYTLYFNVWMPCCYVLCVLPVCPFPGYSTQDLPYSSPADTSHCISWDEIQACEWKGELPVSDTLKKNLHRRPKKSVASIDFLISWIAGNVI